MEARTNSKRKWFETVAAGLLLALALALAYGPAKLDGHSIYSAVIQDVTNLDGFYAWDLFSASELWAGRVPLWNPHNALGTPHLANMQTAVLYPLNWLKFGMGFWQTIDLILMLRLWLAGLFAYLLARRALGASFWPSLIGGAAFMLTGYFTRFVYMSHLNVEVLLPLQLLLVHRLHERATAGRLILAALGFALLILGGFPEATLYAVVLAGGYFLALEGLTRRAVVLAGAAAALGLIVSLAQWLPFAEYYGQAWTYHDSGSGARSLDPTLSVSLILPWLFGDNQTSPVATFTAPYLGATVVLLALYRVTRPGDARREDLCFGVAAFAAFGLIHGFWPLSALGRVFPFSVTYNDKYALPVLALAAAMLAASGAELLVREQRWARLNLCALFLLAVMGLAVWLGLPPRHFFKPAYAYGLLTPGLIAAAVGLVIIAAALALMRSRGLISARALGASLFVLVLVGLLYDQLGNRPMYHDGFADKAEAMMKKFRDGGGKYRFNVDTAIPGLAANRLLPLGLDDLRSYDPLYPRSYVAFMAELNGLAGDTLLQHYHDHMLFTVNPDRLDDPLLHLANVFVHVLSAPENERPFPDDWARTARTVSPRQESWLRLAEFESGGEKRRGLMEHAPARIEGRLPPAPGEGGSPRFLFSAAIPDGRPGAEEAGDGVNLLALVPAQDRERLAFARYLDPGRTTGRGWHPYAIGASFEISLLILPGPRDNQTRDAAVFGEPRVQGRAGWAGLEPIGQGRDGRYAYKDPEAFPRAWWISGLAPVPAGRDFMETLHQAARTNPNTFLDVALTAGPADFEPVGKGLAVEVAVPKFETLAFDPGRMKFHSVRGREGLISISAQYFPGWKAHASSGAKDSPAVLEVKVLRVNGPFLAVPVPPGDWTVEVTYRPWPFRIGLWAMLGGLAAMALTRLGRGTRKDLTARAEGPEIATT